MPLYPVETVRRVELEVSSVTKIPVTVKGDPKGCWILEPGFPDCRFFMPSAIMGPSKEGYVWVINDAEDKMYVPEGSRSGLGGGGGTRDSQGFVFEARDRSPSRA